MLCRAAAAQALAHQIRAGSRAARQLLLLLAIGVWVLERAARRAERDQRRIGQRAAAAECAAPVAAAAVASMEMAEVGGRKRRPEAHGAGANNGAGGAHHGAATRADSLMAGPPPTDALPAFPLGRAFVQVVTISGRLLFA